MGRKKKIIDDKKLTDKQIDALSAILSDIDLELIFLEEYKQLDSEYYDEMYKVGATVSLYNKRLQVAWWFTNLESLVDYIIAGIPLRPSQAWTLLA